MSLAHVEQLLREAQDELKRKREADRIAKEEEEPEPKRRCICIEDREEHSLHEWTEILRARYGENKELLCAAIELLAAHPPYVWHEDRYMTNQHDLPCQDDSCLGWREGMRGYYTCYLDEQLLFCENCVN